MPFHWAQILWGLQVWSKDGEPYLTLGLYVDIGEELLDDDSAAAAAAAAQKQIQYEGNQDKTEVMTNANGKDGLGTSQEIAQQDAVALGQNQARPQLAHSV